MNHPTFFLVISSLLFFGCSKKNSDLPLVEKGAVDFSSWNFDTQGIVELKGKWELSVGKHLSASADFDEETVLEVDVPGGWKVRNKELNLADEHLGTYHIEITVPENYVGELFAIKIGTVASAFDVIVNDEIKASFGKKDTSNFSPHLLKALVPFTIPAQTFSIVIPVSDFMMGNTGIWEAVLFGTYAQISENHTASISIDLFLIGALLIMSMYHFGLFYLRRDSELIIFASLTSFILLRSLNTGNRTINYFIENVNWEIAYRAELIGFYGAAIMFYLFFLSVLPKEFPKLLKKVGILLSTGFTFITIFMSIAFTRDYLWVFQIFTVILIVVAFGGLVLGVVRKRTGALVLLIGTGMAMLGSLNDILYSLQLLDTGFWAHYGFFALILSQAYILAHRYDWAYQENESLTKSLIETNKANARFVPTTFLSLLGKPDIRDVVLGDKTEQRMGVLFCDIRSFTTLSEAMNVDDNFRFINAYLKRMGPIVRANNGFIDKYIGDAIMALFPNGAEDAVKTAIQFQHTLKEYNAERVQQGFQSIAIGVGVHIGDLMLGTVGEDERMDGTVISDAVNLAARLESLTKEYRCGIIVSQAIMDSVSEDFPVEHTYLGKVNVKGKNEEVRIYRVEY